MHSDHQILSAKWRASTYCTIDRLYPRLSSLRSLVRWLESETIQPLLDAIYGPEPRVKITDIHREELLQAIVLADKWNTLVKTRTFSLDLHPFEVLVNMPFNPEEIHYLEDTSSDEGRHSPFMAAIGLGLKSSISFGDGRLPSMTTQERAEVLLETFFD